LAHKRGAFAPFFIGDFKVSKKPKKVKITALASFRAQDISNLDKPVMRKVHLGDEVTVWDHEARLLIQRDRACDPSDYKDKLATGNYFSGRKKDREKRMKETLANADKKRKRRLSDLKNSEKEPAKEAEKETAEA
jgi:hypothetical protein